MTAVLSVVPEPIVPGDSDPADPWRYLEVIADRLGAIEQRLDRIDRNQTAANEQIKSLGCVVARALQTPKQVEAP